MVDSPERLLLDLMVADTEAAVIDLLSRADYWDDDATWRYYNDEPNNFDRAGNQQRHPEGALVEKLVNSVDANLLRRAAEAGADPTSPDGPSSPREAVAVFYEGAERGSIGARQGSLAEWSDARRLEASRDITLAMTGNRPDDGWPCVSIADAGEGQAPDQAPDTILSLIEGHQEGHPVCSRPFQHGWHWGSSFLRDSQPSARRIETAATACRQGRCFDRLGTVCHVLRANPRRKQVTATRGWWRLLRLDPMRD